MTAPAARMGARSRARLRGAVSKSSSLVVLVVLVVVLTAVLAWAWNGGSDPAPAPVVPRPPIEAPRADAYARSLANGDAGERQPVASVVDGASDVPAATELWGRVVERGSGAPIADAELLLQHRDADEFWNLDPEYAERITTLARASSDAEGRFRFAVDASRQLRLFVRAAGHAPTTVLHLFGGSSVVVELSVGAGVDGVVRAEGRAIADAEVRVTVAGEAVELARGRTDAGGAFRFTGLAPTTVFVHAGSPQHEEQREQLALEPGVQQHVEFDLPTGACLSGRVVEATTSLPIVDARVSDSWTMRRVVRTDAAGRFALTGLRDEDGAACHVRALGYAAAVVPVAGRLREPLEVRLVRGGEVRGRLVADGVPVATAYVALGAALAADASASQTDWVPATLGADGRFLALGLHPDRHYWVLVRAPGFASLVYALPRRLGSGESLDLGDLVLRQPGGIEGRVVDDAGDPMPGIDVLVSGCNDDQGRWLATESLPRHVLPFEWRTVATNAAGAFRSTDLAAGEYTLRVLPHGQVDPITTTVRVEDGVVCTGVELVVPTGRTIHGVIACADQSRFGEVLELRATAADGSSEHTTAIGRDGAFRFDGVADGSYILAMLEPPKGWALAPRVARAGAADVRLVLEPSAQITGQVVGPTGKGVKARVWAHPGDVKGSAAAVHPTDDDGHFRIEVPPGFRGSVGGALPDDLSVRGSQPEVVAGQEDVRIELAPH